MQGLVISIINNKGGCAKTTTTVNLAHALDKEGKNVLVIDNDSQCNSSAILINNTSPVNNTLYNLLSQNIPVTTCIYPTSYRRISILPNDQRTAALEIPLAKNMPESLFTYREKLREHVCKSFDIILIDNPPNLGFFVAASLYMTDFVIVPNEAGSMFSFEGLLNAVEFINEIKENGNPDLRFLRLLISKVDRRTNAAANIIRLIRDTFDPDQIFDTVIPVNAAFQQAELQKQSIFRFQINSPGAKAYRMLATELLAILENRVQSDWPKQVQAG